MLEQLMQVKSQFFTASSCISFFNSLQINSILSINHKYYPMSSPIYPNREALKPKGPQLADKIRDLKDKKKRDLLNRHQFTQTLPYELINPNKFPEEQLRILLVTKDQDLQQTEDFDQQLENPDLDPSQKPQLRPSKVTVYNSSLTEYIRSEQLTIKKHNQYEKETNEQTKGKINRPSMVARMKIFSKIRESKREGFIKQILDSKTEIDLKTFFEKVRDIDALRRTKKQGPPAKQIYSYYNSISKQEKEFENSRQLESAKEMDQLKKEIVPCLNPLSQKYLKENNNETTKKYRAHYIIQVIDIIQKKKVVAKVQKLKHETINLETDMENYSLFTYDDQITRSQNYEQINKCLKSSDIKQGTFDDCYFLAAIVSIVSRKPELIYRLFLRLKNPYHFYTVRLFIDGQWQAIPVNLKFSVNQNLDFCCARPNDQKIWVLLLEKAYAKVCGSYENINWGTEQQGVQILTGAPSVHYDLDKDFTIDLMKTELARKTSNQSTVLTTSAIVNYSQGYLTKTPEQLQKERAYKLQQLNGLVPNHCYTILGVFDIILKEDNKRQEVKLIKLCNPWGYRDDGKMVWNGDWGLNSPKWNDELRKKTGYEVNPKDGTFFMSQEDFKRYFKHVNICRLSQHNINSHLDLSKVPKNTFATVDISIRSDGIYSFTLHLKNRRQLSKNTVLYRYRWSWLFLLKKTKEGYKKAYCICESGQNATLQNLKTLQKGDYKIVLKFNHVSTKKHQYCLSSYGPYQVKWQLAKKFQDSDLDDYLIVDPWEKYQPYDYIKAPQEYKNVQDKKAKVYGPPVQKLSRNLEEKPKDVHNNSVSQIQRKFFQINREKTVCFEAPFMECSQDTKELEIYKRLQIYPDFGHGIIYIKNNSLSTFRLRINFGKTDKYHQSQYMSILKPYTLPLDMTVPSKDMKTCKFIICPEFDSKLITYQYEYEKQDKK